MKVRLLHAAALCAVLGAFLFAIAPPARAQDEYFGKNKVQYHKFNWSFIQSDHFDIYFDEGGKALAEYTAAAAESSYASMSKSFRYQIVNRIPIIIYNSHNAFQQTNVVSEYLEEGIGGVTELFKNRVILPFEGEYKKFRHVIHHELVHAVQYEILGPEKFVELYIMGWVNQGFNYAAIPLEMDAYELQNRYEADPTQPFQVKDEVSCSLELLLDD